MSIPSCLRCWRLGGRLALPELSIRRDFVGVKALGLTVREGLGFRA